MDVTVEIPLTRFGEWMTFNLNAERDLGDGSCLMAEIYPEMDDEGNTIYCADLYKAKRNYSGLLHDNEDLKRETFGYLWDAVRFCETVDLGEIETTNEQRL